LYEKKQIRPVVYATYPLRDAARALQAIADRESYGKVVLTP
jgi:NADPH:quinone reductase-like Zn-dependent oxidoreductase